jgi:hypothetical protein
MKKQFYILLTTLSIALLSSASFALGNEPLAEKTKSYSKTYPLGGGDNVNLNNQFGELKVTTWNKNEIKVDIQITAKANTDEAAQNILDNIYIEDSKNGNTVSFQTKMRNNKGNWNKGNKKDYKDQGMSINYLVYMPATTLLNATNSFGAMIIPDMKAAVTLNSKFGSLTTGSLAQVRDINVEFGEAWIEAMNGGKVSIKFSKGSIKNLTGNIEARFEFCDKIRLNVDNNVKDINIRSSYSNLYLNTPTNLSSAVTVKTSFGDFTNKSGFDIKEQGKNDDKYGPKFDKLYIGNAGSGGNKMNIKADFGDVIIGHNLEVDFTSKKKQAKI